MIALVAFDVISGFSCRYFYVDEAFVGALRGLEVMIPLANHEAVLPAQTQGVYVVARRTHGRRFTWIGSYKPVPPNLMARTGDYFGVGIWLMETALDGSRVCDLLEDVAATLNHLMQDKRASIIGQVSIHAINQDPASLAGLSAFEQPVAPGEGLSFDLAESTGRIDLLDRNLSLPQAIDLAQAARHLQGASKVLLPRDAEASRGLRVPPGLPAIREIQRPPTPSPAPPPARAVPPRSQPELYPERLKAIADLDATISRRLTTIEQRIDEMRSSVVVTERIPTILRFPGILAPAAATTSFVASVVATFSILYGFGLIGAVPNSPGTPSLQDRDGRGAAAVVLPPVPPLRTEPSGEPVRAPADDAKPPVGDAGDPYARLDAALSTLAAALDAGSVPVGDEPRRRLQRALGTFGEALQQSPDVKLKAIGDKMKGSQDPTRARLRTDR